MEITKRNKICKIKQYLIYILMIKNQNILAILMIFLSQLKTFMKNFIQKRELPKLPLLNFLVTFLTEKKHLKYTSSPLRRKQFSKESNKIFKLSNKH